MYMYICVCVCVYAHNYLFIYEVLLLLDKIVKSEIVNFELTELFENLNGICVYSDKPVILIVDEIDSAENNQVFIDFLSQLRAYYIDRDIQQTF